MPAVGPERRREGVSLQTVHASFQVMAHVTTTIKELLMTAPKRLLVLLCAALLAALPSVPAAAGDHASCSYDGIDTVTLTVHEGIGIISRAGDRITYRSFDTNGYEQCGLATVHNTNRIRLVDDAVGFDRTLGIDLSNGHLGPGKTPESRGRSEIEIVAEFGGGYESQMSIAGTPHDNRFVIGQTGVKLNRDADVDARVTDAGFYSVGGGRGSDLLSFDGGEGTGPAWGPTEFFDNELVGGAGHDELIGGPGTNAIFGRGMRDLLRGKGGNDYLDGGAGSDEAFGAAGADVIYGRGANDHLEAGRQNDMVRGGRGDDRIDGDQGRDDCDGGPGRDSIEDCER